MEHHQYANLFPMMNNEELAALVEDMRANGYDTSAPIVTHQGHILDGRNRYKASQIAGVHPVYQEFDGTDTLGFVIRHNLHRRHLNESQRGVIASKLATLEHGQVGNGRRPANLHVYSQPQAAEMLNVSPRTVATIKAVEREAPELIEKIERGEMTAHEADKKVKAMRRFEQHAELVKLSETVKPSERWNVFAADIRSAKLEPFSLDAIITDPPYPKEYLPLWDDLGRFAKQYLKPSAPLLAMIPAPYLPQIIEVLGKHLTYQWILACVLPGSHGSVIQSGVRNVIWKPILVYRNGGPPVNIGSDLFENYKRDKDFHEWGQGVGGYLWQIENFTNPNDLVCDPFLGGGTTALAALQLKRRFVGFDCDAEKVAITKGRLSNVHL